MLLSELVRLELVNTTQFLMEQTTHKLEKKI